MTQPEANLRAIRASHGLTLEQAASGMGIQIATLSTLERGHTRPHAGTAKKIADFYGISIESVLSNAAANSSHQGSVDSGQPAVNSVQTSQVPAAKQVSDMQSEVPASPKTTAGPPREDANPDGTLAESA